MLGTTTSPIERAGDVLTLLGLACLLLFVIVALPDLRFPPESEQHRRQVAERRLEREKREAVQALAMRAGEDPWAVACEPHDYSCKA